MMVSGGSVAAELTDWGELGGVAQTADHYSKIGLANFFAKLGAKFLFTNHGVPQQLFLMRNRSFGTRQFFAQCTNLRLKLGNLAQRTTQALFWSQFENRDIVEWFFKPVFINLGINYWLSY
ncbi:MAG: hypothetical protein JNK38_11450 [Acidobacteria bacterium]|nr:hypothetical protein [Acidobacteriota bacterium]